MHSTETKPKGSFAWLNATQFLGALNDNVFRWLILFFLIDHFGKDRSDVLSMTIAIIFVIPFLLFTPFAGKLAGDPDSIYRISLAASFTLGFFVMSAGSLGFQYAAEVSYPAPESTSQGILLWVGQLTGMIFVAGMSIRENQYLGIFMNTFVFLSVLSLVAVLLLRESEFSKKSAGN